MWTMKIPYVLYAHALLAFYELSAEELRERAERGVRLALQRHKARENRRYR